MGKPFYSRLAVNNIRRNRSIYTPYLLAGMLIVALFYILSSVAIMTRESGMEGGGHMYEMLNVSGRVCGILSLAVLLYINSFVMKRRKREFGLYSILGMGKRHISLIILWEVALTALASVLGGIAGGALMSQLLFLVLLRLVKVPVSLTFRIPLHSVLSAVLLFSAGFLLVLAVDIVSVWRGNPAELLRSASQGEREPKARWLIAVLGAGLLLSGYLVAWSARSPYDAMTRFFPAVLLVIAGTMLTFLAGSIAVLKMLKRKKRFYYRPGNFIAVSGMLYRMKQNAMGLANICILSTCVLVTLSSTLCLFLGEEDALRKAFPRQVHVSCRATGDNAAAVRQAAERHAAEQGFTVADDGDYYSFAVPAAYEDEGFAPRPYYDMSGVYSVTFLPLEDYNRLVGGSGTLDHGEAFAALPESVRADTLAFGNLRYRVKGAAEIPALIDIGDPAWTVVAVVPSLEDLEAVKAVYDDAGFEKQYSVWYDYWYNSVGDEGNLSAFYASLGGAYRDLPDVGLVDSIDAARRDFYQVYGSLLFIGIFFVTLFLTATVLIIYYKQITEGFDDRERFQIMEKVGMSGAEVRAAIRKQVLLVFFLPLGMAMAHIAAAFPTLRTLLLVFGMDNYVFFAGCVVGVALAFSVLYFAVYRLTARTYFRIIHTSV